MKIKTHFVLQNTTALLQKLESLLQWILVLLENVKF